MFVSTFHYGQTTTPITKLAIEEQIKKGTFVRKAALSELKKRNATKFPPISILFLTDAVFSPQEFFVNITVNFEKANRSIYIVVVYCPRSVLQTTSSIPPDQSDLRRPFSVFLAAAIPKFAGFAIGVESTMGLKNQILIEDD